MDPVASAGQSELATLGPQQLEPTDQDAETGRVEEVDVGQVDDDVAVTALDELVEVTAQRWCSGHVNLTDSTQDDGVVERLGGQCQMHETTFPSVTCVRTVPPDHTVGTMPPPRLTRASDPSEPAGDDSGAPSAVKGQGGASLDHLLERLSVGARADRLRHRHHVPAREAELTDFPAWVAPPVAAAWWQSGITQLWSHQAEAAEAAHQGEHVVISTGTASGKSLGYLIPVLSDLIDGTAAPTGRGATALYLAPTKALAHDQRSRIEGLAIPGLRAAAYDGDTPPEERRWIRDHAAYVLTNPDLLHHSLLPGHERWAPFLRALKYVVVDECHAYRGVFGSHVALVLRRLRRVAARYRATPTFVLASATIAEPAAHATRLVGMPVRAVTRDGSPRAGVTIGLWEPPMIKGDSTGGNSPVDSPGEHRRSAVAEAGDLLADLVEAGVHTVAFTRSRVGAEVVAASAASRLADRGIAPGLVAAYRGGYLPEERRVLEADLRSGRLRGLAATTALELGIDISGLDAVIVAGWPGTLASFWQQIGRAGRAGRESLAIFVAADDPLDSYLVHHPSALFERPVETTVVDPDNPYVLAPHLAAAAAEFGLTEDDVPLFGTGAQTQLDRLVAAGILRRRPRGWFWARPDRASDHVTLRGIGANVGIVERRTGRVLGLVDGSRADATVHAGAVYVHQGDTFVVDELDLELGEAVVVRGDPGWSTQARTTSTFDLGQRPVSFERGELRVSFGEVTVHSQVTSFLRRAHGGEVLGEHALDLPVRTLRTRGVWWTLPPEALLDSGLDEPRWPGVLHAAEHAMIGMLPLIATADRWDVGGVSTALHPDTGLPTVLVYDGLPGGAGFAERGYAALPAWVRATLDAVASCRCERGCPACVQSPKCGNGNEPLDKAGAIEVLRCVARLLS